MPESPGRFFVPPVIALVVLLAAAALPGCTRSAKMPDLRGMYDRSAQTHGPGRNPVIVIPGVLGSRLVDDASGRVVWGAFGGGAADPETADGAALVALPMTPDSTLADLRDGVRPDGALDRLEVSLFGVPVRLNAYLQILATLGVGGYRDEGLGLAGAIDYGDEHFTCFQFDYDWRRDNVENARLLHAFLLEKRAYVQEQYRQRYGLDEAEVKFDIVAHSMGGLITRYLLRYGDADLPEDGRPPVVTWAGTDLVDKAILVGTPSAGSCDAIAQLVDGAKFAFFLPQYEPAVLGTMPSIYQLLPRTRHAALVGADGGPIDLLDPATWEVAGWGLADPGQDRVLARLLPGIDDPDIRRAIARDHLHKCLERARRLFDALDVPAATPPGLDLILVAGDAEPTPAVLAADDRGRLSVTERGPGDGTVLRTSALMDDRVGRPEDTWTPGVRSPVDWDRVTFLFTDHLGLTKDPAFTDNVLYELLEAPRSFPPPGP